MGRLHWIAAVAAIALAATTAAAQVPDSTARQRAATATARSDPATTVARDDSARAVARRDSLRRDSLRRADAHRDSVSATRRDSLRDATMRVPGTTGKPLTWTIVCLLVYFISIVLSRWNHIGRSVHQILERQLGALATRLETEVGSNGACKEVGALRARVATLQAESTEARTTRYLSTWSGFSEFLFWSRGRENAMWIEIHEIERQLASFLAPIEQVNVYLIWASTELAGLERSSAKAIAAAIQDALKLPLSAFDGERQVQERTRKALLGRALSIIYADRDTSFATLMEWQNKASWLAFTALLAIGFIAAVAGNPALLLAGGIGGYLSRVMRALTREDVPLDYGASWTTLYLSPLFGALAGWFGIALITLIAAPDLQLLGNAFQQIRWDRPTTSITLGIAFLLGFSERFFDAIVGAVEKHAERTEDARRTAPVRPVPPVPDMGGARDGGPAGPPSPDGMPGGVVAPAGLPFITTTERHGVKTNEPKETLVVRGAGFVPLSRMRVNGRERDAEVRSATEIALTLTSADLSAIELGDFIVAVVNPGGTATAERHVYETV